MIKVRTIILRGHVSCHKNLGLIGSAVLTFIGYKQTNKKTNKQTDKLNLYIEKNMFSIEIEA